MGSFKHTAPEGCPRRATPGPLPPPAAEQDFHLHLDRATRARVAQPAPNLLAHGAPHRLRQRDVRLPERAATSLVGLEVGAKGGQRDALYLGGRLHVPEVRALE